MSTKLVIIGAGSAMFGLGTLGDILKCRALEGSEIVLHDINAAALKTVETTARSYIEEKSLPYKLMATTSRQEALQDADFCIMAIEIGNRFELWEQDWKIPLQYGIRQVFGENGGPGGLFHSLRIIPPILDICGDIQAFCPNAYVFNLSNPLVRISHAVYTKYPYLKYMGLCDLLANPIRFLPALLQTPATNLHIRAGGFNHCSIIVEINYIDTGKDAYPEIREKGPEYFLRTPAFYGVIGERTLFVKLLERFGYMVMTTDAHIGEFISWAYDAADHRAILEFYETYKKSMQLPREPDRDSLKGTAVEDHWRAVPIIEGILTDSNHEELAVNIPNDGFIEYLPRNQVVEVPAIINKSGVHGITLNRYPKAFAGLLMNQVAVNDMTTEAVLTGSKDVALQALLVDPVVNNMQAAENMLDTFLKLQEPYLNYLR